MKPIHTTLLMGLVAVVTCSVAAFYFPWPEAENTDNQNTKLFEEFDEENNKVWSIKLAKYDRETEGLKSFSLRRKGQRWVIPAKSNYVATGAIISVVESCLNEKNILEEQSEDQQDHEKFGVLDPLDYQKAINRDSVGIKLTLEDVNRNSLASLIIGDKVRGTQNQHYVRKPGQPKVYIVEFDPTILTTALGNWLDPNLLNLQTPDNTDGSLLDEIVIENYRIAPDKLAGQERDDRYRVKVRPYDENPDNRIAMETPNDSGWETQEVSPDNRQPIGIAIQAVQFTVITDVRPREKELAKLMASDLSKLTGENFKEATELGFRFSKSEDGVELDGSSGELTVNTAEGVKVSILIGNLATSTESAANALNYNLMIVADVTDDMKSQPEKPTAAEGGQLSEDEEREFARQLEEWTAKSKNAKAAAEQINRIHGDWYYIVSEDVVEALRPEISVAQPTE